MNNIKGSDTNVGSIEKDIKRCEELIKTKHSNWIGLTNQTAIKIVLENLKALCDMQILSNRELKNAKQINEEHKKENGLLRKRVKELEEENKKYIVKLTDEQYKNLIHIVKHDVKKEFKQKIVDKIQERKFELQQEYKDFENDEILQTLQKLI